MTWQLQPLLPAGHNKSLAAGASLGVKRLTIILALCFTHNFFVGGPKKQRRYQQV